MSAPVWIAILAHTAIAAFGLGVWAILWLQHQQALEDMENDE